VLLRAVLAAQNVITADKQETCTSARQGGRWTETIQEEAETVRKTWERSRQQLAVLCTGPVL